MKKRTLPICLILFLLCSTLFRLKVAAADFTNGVDVSGTTATIWFKSDVSTTWVDVHYKINSGDQQNIRMSYNGSKARYEQNVTVSTGNVIDYSFTYNNGTPAYDTAWYSYTVGSSTPAPSGSGVTFYQDINYGGTAVTLDVGTYTLSQLNAAGIPDNWMSSLKVTSGYLVEVYQNDNFTGTKWTYTSSSSWVGTDINDQMSSVKILAAVFYQDINYGGTAVALQPGNYTLSQLNAAGIPDNWMSSLKVTSGWTVEVYQNDNFSGTKWTYTSSSSWVGTTVNDQMSSVKIYIGSSTAEPPLKSGYVTLQVNNNTGGRYSNDQIYWAIVGQDPVSKQFVHVDLAGNLIPMQVADNDAAGHLTKTTPDGTFNYSNYFYKVSQQSYAYIPKIIGARMYISYGEPLYIRINQAVDGSIGYAGPNLANTSDPNTGILFEWAEFAWVDSGLWINTTRVDQFCYPYYIQLVGNSGYSRTGGDIGTRADLMNAFSNSVPAEFKSLVHPDRIYAPASGLGTFTAGQANAHYFDSYINDVYNYYTTHELTFTCDRGTYSGHVVGTDFVFNKNGGAYNLYIHGKPSTQEVLLGNGIFDGGNDDEKAIKAQVCAAFNRHVMLDPAHWNNSSYFYQAAPANYFAAFWHQHSYENRAYGFCYDDVFDFSSTLQVSDPKYAIINVGW